MSNSQGIDAYFDADFDVSRKPLLICQGIPVSLFTGLPVAFIAKLQCTSNSQRFSVHFTGSTFAVPAIKNVRKSQNRPLVSIYLIISIVTVTTYSRSFLYSF